MATKQALREFQSRLAERLQSTQAAGAEASWLAVEAGGMRLLFPLNHAGEIFPWTHVQAVPYVQPWFLGVANLRGGLSGVVDLAAFMRGAAAEPRGELALAQCRLVAFNPLLETNCALLVDRLLGLRTMEAFADSAQPAESEPAYFGHLYTDDDGVSWQEINLQALSLTPSFLSIGT
ncbi:MAG: chemotaxis protein CheW [Comamonadaceae bacterium]|nr:chemotaxis protein CheW [Comamonadaceae bacterium]